LRLVPNCIAQDFAHFPFGAPTVLSRTLLELRLYVVLKVANHQLSHDILSRYDIMISVPQRLLQDPFSAGNGQLNPALAGRFNVNRTVDGATPTRRAISLSPCGGSGCLDSFQGRIS